MNNVVPLVTMNENDDVVLHDAQALETLRAVNRHKCRLTLGAHADRMKHFVRRFAEMNYSPMDWVIVIIRVDDPIGGQFVAHLMPGHDWTPIRKKGETPYARGILGRVGLQACVDYVAHESTRASARALREHEGIAVVVIDSGTIEVFSPEDATR